MNLKDNLKVEFQRIQIEQRKTIQKIIQRVTAIYISLLITEIYRIRMNKELRETDLKNKEIKKEKCKEELFISIVVAIYFRKEFSSKI